MPHSNAIWQIVPYTGQTPFKRVRVRNDSRIRQVLRYLYDHDYVIVLGPPHSEKTHLLRDVADALHTIDLFQPVHVNLWHARSDDETTFFTSLALLISQAAGRDSVAPPETVPNARRFQHYLEDCLQAADRHIALLVEHLQTLPQDLVHSLLLALRSVYMERNLDGASQLVAVIAGGMSLAGLSVGRTSPFNIARPVVIAPLTEAQGLALARETLAAYNRRVSDNALQRLLEWAGGDYYLLPLLCAWSAEVVQGYQRPLITTTVVNRAAQRLLETGASLAPVRDAIQIVEEDPDTVLDVLYLLDRGALPRTRSRQPITRTGIDRLQLSGALKLVGESHQFKNRLYRQALGRHFTPAQVGHVLRMTGRWQEAIAYLAPRVAQEPEAEARAHLLEAIVQSIYAADALDKAYDGLLRGLQLGFGLKDVHIYRPDPTRSELRLVRSPLQTADVKAVIGLADSECVEAQTFIYGDYALRRNENDVRLVAALVPEHRPIGLVTVERYVSDRVDLGLPRDLLALLRFLRHAAGAVETVMLRSAYQEIGRAVLEANAFQPTLKRVLRAVSNALGCDFAALYLIDTGNTWLELAANVGQMPPVEMTRFERTSHHPAAQCLSERKSLLVHGSEPLIDSASDEHFGGHQYLRVFLPLRARGEDLGALGVGYQGNLKTGITEEDARNLVVFADQVAVAVYNMQLLRRTDATLARRVEELDRLADISLTVSSTLELEAVLARIIENVRALFPAIEATVFEYHPGEGELSVLQTSLEDAAYRAQRLNLNSITGQAVRARQAQIVSDIQSRAEYRWESQARKLKLRGMMAMPLIRGKRVLGTINIYTASPYRFSADEEDLLRAFAAQATVAIDNARQYQALESARRELEDMREREMFDLAKALLHRIGNATGDIPFQLQRARQAAVAGQTVEEPLSHVEQRIDSLLGLIDPLKGLVNLNDISSTQLDLREVITIALDRSLPCQGITVDVDLPVAPVLTEGNQALLCDAFQSVIENACEALAGDGTLIVRMSQLDEKSVEVRVRDNGPGIPGELLPRIFEPGFSTKLTSRQGRGQGLFTCRAILRRHRGFIRAESTPGQGTTFVVRLPVLSTSFGEDQ